MQQSSGTAVLKLFVMADDTATCLAALLVFWALSDLLLATLLPATPTAGALWLTDMVAM